MRLVVSGYHGFGNIGDEAILAGMLETLRSIDERAEVTVLSGNPAETERSHGVAAIRRADVPAILHALRRADGLISGGGSLLQDRTSVRPVAYYTGIMQLARLARRPYAVHAQGLGPLRRSINRSLAARALARAAHVSLRDPASVEVAQGLGVRRPIDLVPDPALALKPPINRVPGRLVVAVRAWGPSRDHASELRAALRELSADHHIVAVPMQEPADREVSEQLVAGITGAEIVPANATFAERLASIGSAELVIAMRLHALVLAAAAGVPALGISYDPKVDAFASLVGQPIVGSVGTAIQPMDLVGAVGRALAGDLTDYRNRVAGLRTGLRPGMVTTLSALGWRGDSGQLGGR